MARGRLEKRLDKLLACACSHKDDRRFKDHLEKQRREILTFLHHADIEAANGPAEQAIRPAVRNRKIFGGNRIWSGAAARECLASFFATCGKNAVSTLDTLPRIICRPMPAA